LNNFKDIKDKKFEKLGIKTLCASLDLMTLLEKINSFAFIEKDFLKKIEENVFTNAQLIASLINLSVLKINNFFSHEYNVFKLYNINNSSINSGINSYSVNDVNKVNLIDINDKSSNNNNNLVSVETVISNFLASIEIELLDDILFSAIVSNVFLLLLILTLLLLLLLLLLLFLFFIITITFFTILLHY
jgi:hypothetical protein